MSAGDRVLTDRVAAAKQSLVNAKDRVRRARLEPFGAIRKDGTRVSTQGQQAADRYARAVEALERAEVELAEAKAALGR